MCSLILVAKQRSVFPMYEALALKKEHMLNMQKSQDALIEMGKSVSASLNTLGRSVSDGLGLLAMALNPNVMQMTKMKN